MDCYQRFCWNPLGNATVDATMRLTLVIDHSGKEESQQGLPDGEALEDRADQTGGSEQLGHDGGIGRGGDKTPVDGGHIG